MSVEMELRETSSPSFSSSNDGYPDGNMALGQPPDLNNRYHPLLNALILDKVFEHVRKNDLKECRQVNREWSLLSTPFMRSKFLVVVHCGQSPYSKETEYTRRVEHFVETFKSNKFGIPFDNYQLGPFCATEGVGQEFLKLIGVTTKMIDLCEYHPDDNLKSFAVEDISAVLTSMPNLESFQIPTGIYSHSGDILKLFPETSPKPRLTHLKNLSIVYDNFSQERRKYCPTFHEELFEVAPNISEIAMTDVVEDGMSTGVEILNVIEKLGRESSMEELSFLIAGIDIVESLQRLSPKLKLKKLDINLMSPEDPDSVIHLFTETMESLQVSKIIFNSFKQFPKLPRLRTLKLQISTDFKSKLNLNKMFPALEKLSLCQRQDGSLVQVFDEFISDSESCPNMKSFALHRAYLRISPFNHIINIFPKLTSLNVRIKEDAIEILMRIWTQMRELESLALTGKIQTTVESLDSVFTGISIQGILENQQAISTLDKMTPELRGETIVKLRNQHC